MIPPEISQYLTSWFQREISPSTRIISTVVLGGGSINEAFCIETSSGQYFLKFNLAKRYPGMFAAEARGLGILANAECIQVPDVIHNSETGNYSFLLLHFIKSQLPATNFWQLFGQKLARLHQKTSPDFGLDHDNYIGSLKQSNKHHLRWTDFLVEERIQPQVKMAFDDRLIDNQDLRRMELLYKKLPEILPVEPPSLIHGDLWSGNYMVGSDGNPCIIDPAVYYGHREMDIAMSKLFGGFTPEFYRSYNEEYPMEKGWEKRVGLNQLYPLLVHVNLFGGGYSRQVRQILLSYL
ncbi:MAG: fructosamine kinase family protein [Lentimicrobium sp.]